MKKVFTKTTAKKKNGGAQAKVFFKKNLPYFLLAIALVAVALAVTLTLVFTADKPLPVDNTPKSQYTLPVASYTDYSPVKLTSYVYSETLNRWTTKNGVDFYTAKGANVLAVKTGTVTSVKDTVLDGRVVIIDHGEGLISTYRNLATDSALEVGDAVTKGQVIGTVTDEIMRVMDGAPHLTLEMKVNGKFVDPIDYFPELADK